MQHMWVRTLRSPGGSTSRSRRATWRCSTAFHRDAIAAGGRDNGAPGPRPQYSGKYYGAFVLDPDGNNIEATWHA